VSDRARAIVFFLFFARFEYALRRADKNFVEQGIHQYELKFRLQRTKWLKKEARSLDLQLLPA
jgi:hypothetical protein